MIADALLTAINRPNLSADDVVKILDRASRYWMNGARTIAQDAEIAIRLLDRGEDFEAVLPGSREVIDSLAREAGLFPYMSDDLSLGYALAREVHRVPNFVPASYFHAEQRSVFSKLLAGDNVVLSAPTSFGKTLLVDALIAAKQPKLAIIVVPTIALLEERRRTLIQRFPEYKVVTQSFQPLEGDKVILVGTQERILERADLPDPDLFVIDEFYKLDLTKDKVRARSLHLLLAKYIDVAKQVYLLGPSIEANPVDAEGRANFSFIKTHYSPVAADVIQVQPPGADPDTLANILGDEREASSLVYCRSPKSARTVSRQLIERGVRQSTDLLGRLAGWLRENYHPDWYLADALERGIGIHHGRVPRAIAHLMVQLFNAGHIKVLLCTSSLIEGVNTAAENVLIYDKYISTSKLDRFTFDNIKGRAGRMFRHFVGKVYLFNPAPEQVYETLDIPLLTGPDKLSDREILQLPEARLSPTNQARRKRLLDQLSVPEPILAEFARFGIEDIEKIYLELIELLESNDRSLCWTGIGRYPQVLRSMEAVWGRIDFEKHGVHSARQFALFATRLAANDTLKEFLASVANGDDVDESLDLAFNFLKGAEYSFVDPLRLLEKLIHAALDDETVCDYSKFLAGLTSWGLPGHLKALEELGVPTPIIQKLIGHIDHDDIDNAIKQIRGFIGSGRHLTETDCEVLGFTLAQDTAPPSLTAQH